MVRTPCAGERPSAGPFTRWRGVGRGRATDGYGGVKGYDEPFVMSITALAECNIDGIPQGRR
jgi:hypothetical protein